MVMAIKIMARKVVTNRELFQDSIGLIRARLKFSLTVIIGLGVLFGLVLAAHLWLHGLEDTYTRIASEVTDGKVILVATNDMSREANPGEARISMNREEMIRDLEQYGGEIVGDLERFGNYGGIVVPAELLDGVAKTDLSDAPADAAPVLVSTLLGEQLLGENYIDQSLDLTKKLDDYEHYREEIIGKTLTDRFGAKYYIAGLAPSNFHTEDLSFAALEKGNVNLLNPLLSQIRTPSLAPIIIDNGTSKTWQRGEEDEVADDSSAVLVVFEDNEAAYNYFRRGCGIFPNIDARRGEYYVDIVAGMSPEILYLLHGLENIVGIASLALMIVALIVLSVSLHQTLKQSAKELAKYRRRGLMVSQIRMVHIYYCFMLMIGVVLLALGLASLVVILFSTMNQNLLSAQYLLGFSLDAAPQVMYYGLGIRAVIILAMIPLTGVLAALIGTRKLGKKDD